MRLYPAIAIKSDSGLEELADLMAADLDGFNLLALENLDGAVRAFFPDESSRATAIAWLREHRSSLSVAEVDVPDENWAERSQAALRAIKAGGLTIAPPWDAPSGPSETTIIVEPSMGFGTGHHATTRLCLLALQDAGVAGSSVLDVGTGSGVLAIAAARLGARRVVGIDNDPDAIDNARTNMRLNGVAVEFIAQGLEMIGSAHDFDLILANLTGATLTRFADRIAFLASGDGRLILSGLREEEEEGVVAAFGGELKARSVEDGWVCLVLRVDRGP